MRQGDETGIEVRQLWGAIRELRERMREIEVARARDASRIREEVDSVFGAVKVHVEEALEPVRSSVGEVLARIRAQDIREAERERLKAELRQEQEAERKRVDDQVARELTRTGQHLELRLRQDSVVDARIDGTRKHKIAKWTVAVGLLTALATLITLVLRSYAGPQGQGKP